jgi:short-subunit dehydrogenase
MASQGHTALVTGASAGIGRELAKLAAQDRRDLVLVARRRDRLEALAAELRAAHGVAVTVIAADLGQARAAQEICAQVEAAGIEVECLMNNAGFGSFGPFVRMERTRQLEMIDVNIRALVELCHLFLPGMLQRKHGHILNVASVAGFVPGPNMATYYASKAFVVSFTEGLATELRGSGVSATASCPGPTATEFGDIAGNKRSELFRRGVAEAAPVARHAYRAMLAGRVVAIPGLMNKVLALSSRFVPRALLRSGVARLNRPRQP